MPTEATDRELADFLTDHIENPCVEPTTGQNIRGFYIREAKRMIGTFKDTAAISKLEEAMQKYTL